MKKLSKKLQEDLYIFTDKEETKWETEVVYRILEGQSIKNRFTNITFN